MFQNTFETPKKKNKEKSDNSENITQKILIPVIFMLLSQEYMQYFYFWSRYQSKNTVHLPSTFPPETRYQKSTPGAPRVVQW